MSLKCISCQFADATLTRRNDETKRFCSKECFNIWKSTNDIPVGEGLFMQMLRMEQPSTSTSSVLSKDIFWKIMKEQHIDPRALAIDIGDTTGIPDTKEAYWTWRKGMKTIVKWLTESLKTPTEGISPSYLNNVLYFSIVYDFIELRNYLWRRVPKSERDEFLDFSVLLENDNERNLQKKIVILARHWPDKLWEHIQQRRDPLDLGNGIFTLLFAAASANPINTSLIQYFGRYFTIQNVLKYLTSGYNVDEAIDVLKHPDTYVSGFDNKIYKEVGKIYSTSAFYSLTNEQREEIRKIIEVHPKFKMPPTYFRKVFSTDKKIDDDTRRDWIDRFTPMYTSDEISEIFISFLFLFDRDTVHQQAMERFIDNMADDVLFPVEFDEDTPPFIFERLIIKERISSINNIYEAKQLIDYVAKHDVEDLSHFIEFVLFFNQRPLDFSTVLLIDVGKILSMGPGSRTLMYMVLKNMPKKSLDAEFKRKIWDTYGDEKIQRLLDEDIIMEPEYKKLK